MSSQYFGKILKLVVARHGQSQYNLAKRWSGWTDTRLTQAGILQAKQCAQMLKQHDFTFDQSYASALTRSVQSLNIILDELDQNYITVNKSWMLNEKHYGILEGEVKSQMKKKYGVQIINEWRRGFSTRPPGLSRDDWQHPCNDPRYKNVNPNLLPSSQSLQDVIKRVRYLWQSQISMKLLSGKKMLMIVHGSTIRALLRVIFNQSIDTVKGLNFPNGTPIIMNLTEQLKPINYQLLGDAQQIKLKMKKIKQQIN